VVIKPSPIEKAAAMTKGNRPANPFNGDSRVACSPPHGLSGTEGGKAIYRLNALEYYVARARQRYEANLKLPGSCLIASAALLLALSMLALAILGRIAVATPALFAYYPQEQISGSGHLPSALLLPADAANGLELRSGAKLNCRINGKEERMVITEGMKFIDPETASRELGMGIEQVHRLGDRLLLVGVSPTIEAPNGGGPLMVIRSVRLIDLFQWGLRVRH
jgi:hypothetical protein